MKKFGVKHECYGELFYTKTYVKTWNLCKVIGSWEYRLLKLAYKKINVICLVYLVP